VNVIGLKPRLTNDIAGTNDLEGLRRAQEAAAPFGLLVIIPMGQSLSPMRAIVPLLRRGDIVTHIYAPPPNGILDVRGPPAAGRDCGAPAWCPLRPGQRGANAHLRWDVVEGATRQGFWPDTLSPPRAISVTDQRANGGPQLDATHTPSL
jgi:dihydroorotase